MPKTPAYSYNEMKVSEQDINQIADEYMKYEFRIIANMLSGEYSISSFLNNIGSWMSASDIHYRHEVYDNVHMKWGKGGLTSLKNSDTQLKTCYFI